MARERQPCDVHPRARWCALILRNEFAAGLVVGCVVFTLACVPAGAEPVAPRSSAESTLQAQTSAPSAPVATPAPARSPPKSPETELGVRDRGIFSDLDARVRIELPRDLVHAQIEAAVDRARSQLVLYHAAWPIKVYPLAGDALLRVGTLALSLRPGDRAELEPLLVPERLFVFDSRVELPPGDRDDDGIPDPLDVSIGAQKTALNADRYDGRYLNIAYPNGDVPRTIGVCTDVVIRALRNAGIDLQRELQADRARLPRAYPSIRTPNPSIDHRRVKNLLPLFERYYEAHTTVFDDASDPYLPGDVVFMDTFSDRPGSEHIGVVSDMRSPSGPPLIINNWTDGTVTKAMDLLSFVPVTKRFRVPARSPLHGPISPLRTQLVTVVSSSWSDQRAELRRFARAPGERWRPAGATLPVMLGRSGYGWGDGLHGRGAPAGRPAGSAPLKREGDGRSPAGVFEIGPAHGYAEQSDLALQIPYARADESLRCVDDPESRHYNRVLSEKSVTPDWRSAEIMRRTDDLYELTIEIAHNRAPLTPGHGSCIFLHVWASPTTPVTGCTALSKADLFELARWLAPNAAVLVALPRSEYRALASIWGLPD